MANKEIERKFIATVISEVEEHSEFTAIQQAYVCIGSGEEVRIRREKTEGKPHRYTLTAKCGSGLVRDEYEIVIDEIQYAVLFQGANSRVINKIRYTVPYQGSVLFVDKYLESLEGLVIAEVEFPSEAEASKFVPPTWFGQEVTEDSRFKNSSLALKGKPLFSFAQPIPVYATRASASVPNFFSDVILPEGSPSTFPTGLTFIQRPKEPDTNDLMPPGFEGYGARDLDPLGMSIPTPFSSNRNPNVSAFDPTKGRFEPPKPKNPDPFNPRDSKTSGPRWI